MTLPNLKSALAEKDTPEAKGFLMAIEGLEAVMRRVPIMGSQDDYRAGQQHALEACNEQAQTALTAILALFDEAL